MVKMAILRVTFVLAIFVLIGSSCAQAQIDIYTAQQLEDIGDNLTGNYVLENNINASSIPNFAPIGSAADPFTGTLNGQGFTISNLNINTSTSDVGLFAVASGTIENLGVTSETIITTASTPTIGGIAGVNTGMISQSYTAGSTLSAIGASYATVGGLVGENGGTISYSRSSNSVQIGAGAAGGLIGINSQTVSHSYATGPVTGGNGSNAGGLIGASGPFGSYSSTSAPYGSVSQSYATGNVTGGTASYVGGLIGDNGSQVVQSYATGNASGGAGGAIGGLIGFHAFQAILSQSFATGSVTGVFGGNMGGLVGWNYDATIEQSYALGVVKSGVGGNAGGLVGENGGGCSPCSASIDQSYAAGAVSTIHSGQTGGLVGLNYPSGQTYDPGVVTNSYWDPPAIGPSAGSAGTQLTTSQLQSGALPSGFDPTVWRGITGQYPQLQWQNQLAITSLPSFPTISSQVPSVSTLPTSITNFGSFLTTNLASFAPSDQSFFQTELGQVGGLLTSNAKALATKAAPILNDISVGMSFGSAVTDDLDLLTNPETGLKGAVQIVTLGNDLVGLAQTVGNVNDPSFTNGTLIASSANTLEGLVENYVEQGLTNPKDIIPILFSFDVSIVGFDLGLAAPLLAQFGQDPIDPNFQSVFVPNSVFPSDLVDPANPAFANGFNKLDDDLLNASAYLNAAEVSYNRYEGTLQAGDAQSAVLQMKALLFYLSLYNTSAQQASSDINSFLSLLISDGIPNSTFDPSLFSELQNYLEANGLSADVLAYLEGLGLSISEIDQILTDFENFDGSTLSGNLYGDLSQASVDLLANTTIPTSVPEPSTVVLLCCGFALLIVFGAKRRSAGITNPGVLVP